MCIALKSKSLEIGYIWGTNIYIFIPNKHQQLFCHLRWGNFPIHLVHIFKNISSSSSSYRGNATTALIYCTPPMSSSNDQEHLGYQIFIGSQGCDDVWLICRHSCSWLSEVVCVLENKISPSIDNSKLNSPSSDIIGRPSYPGPLASGDRQCLWHACREHWRPDAQDKGPIEVPPQGGMGGKEDVYGGLPPAASALLPLCRIGGRTSGGGGDGYPEKVIQSPGHQVETFLL